MSEKKQLRILVAIIVAILLSYLIASLFFGISTFADALRGIETLHQWQKGGDWNVLSYPTIHGEFSFFVAWWSPAQWMLFLFVENLIGNNPQLIQILLVSISISIGLYFYYKLFRFFHFSKTIALISILGIITNQLFYWHFLLYYGGDLLIFAFFPAFLLFLVRLKTPFSFSKIILLIFISLFGVFLKNTVLLFFLAGMIYLIISQKVISKRDFKSAFSLFFSTLLVVGISYFFFLSKGETPSSAIDNVGYNNVSNNFLGDICYSLGSPMGIITRLTPLMQKAIHFLENYAIIGSFLQLFAVFMTFLLFRFIYLNYFNKEKNVFFNVAFYFVLPILLVFDYFYLKNSAVSYEMRHFSPLAFLFIPVVIEWIMSLKKMKKLVTGIAVFISVIDFSGFFIQRKSINKTHSYYSGFLLKNEEVVLLKFVQKWDENNTKSLLLVENYWLPTIGVTHNSELALRIENGNWKVVSGMELDNAPNYSLKKIRATHYQSILLIIAKNANELLPELKEFKFQKQLETEHHIVYLLVD